MIRRARIAIALLFAVHGAVTGTFATRIPWIADHLHTDAGGLGLALLFGSVGAMTMMPLTGRFTARIRAKILVPVLMVLWCFAVIVPALAPNLPVLCLAMFLYGAAAGSADVAMNAQGVAVEQAAGRSIMSGLHGMWSLGGLVGSGVGVLAAHANLAAPLHFLFVGTALAVLAVAVSPGLLAAVPAVDDAPAFALPPRPVILIALVGFAAVFCEVASSDWAAVYLTDVANAGPALAAAAFSGFAATMAIVRLIGDRIVDRFGPVRTVQVGGVAATVGALVVALSRTPALAIGSFALIGVGVAVVVPLAFTAAGNAGPHTGQQIAGVATIAYGAGLAAPASIGGIAQVTSLSTSFYVVATLAALLIVGAPALRRRAGTPTAGGSATHPVPAAFDR